MLTRSISFIGVAGVSVILQLLVVGILLSATRVKDHGDRPLSWFVLVWCVSGAALLCALHIIRRGTIGQRVFGVGLAAFPVFVFLAYLYLALEPRFSP